MQLTILTDIIDQIMLKFKENIKMSDQCEIYRFLKYMTTKLA